MERVAGEQAKKISPVLQPRVGDSERVQDEAVSAQVEKEVAGTPAARLVPVPEKIRELNVKHAVISNLGGKCLIMEWLLQAVYRSADQPLSVRMRAAMAALPYEHPKLAVTAVLDGTEDLGARLSRAIQRSAKVIELRAAQPEPAPSYQPTAQEVSTAAMHRPMALIRRR
jgi:hypothetical protein